MNFIKTPVKGMCDFLPEEKRLRNYCIDKLKEVYTSFGFNEIETPCVENINNLQSKVGGENEKLIFKILKRGEKLNLEEAQTVDDLVDSGLRYDLTVPLTRMFSNNMNELTIPFKALQMGYVWRADRPQKGRFRQFMQCDLDIIGDETNIAEIDLINATKVFLNELGIKNISIRINDRRILIQSAIKSGFKESDIDLVLISLDKIDKIGLDGVREELLNNGFNKEIVTSYLDNYKNLNVSPIEFCKNFNDEFISGVVDNLNEIIKVSNENNNDIKIVFDPTLVRGMSYYTGPIFEISVEGYNFSIGGGGRYDKMIEKYINVSVPACGFSVGFDRILTILKDKNFKIPNEKNKIAYLIDKNAILLKKEEAIKEANRLRNEGNIVLVTTRNKNAKYQKEKLNFSGYTEIKEIF